MQKEIFLVIFVIFAISYYIDGKIIHKDITLVRSSIDGRIYPVRNLPDKLEASNMLAKLNQNTLKLINHLKENFPNDDRVIRLEKNYNPDNISETSGEEGANYTSYTVNKGEAMVLCLRDRKNNKIIDLNTLSYSVFHEISHEATLSISHTEEFWNNFKWLLGEAVKAGLYEIEDYSKTGKIFCGIRLNSNILLENNNSKEEPNNT
jgi:hypothetical protein